MKDKWNFIGNLFVVIGIALILACCIIAANVIMWIAASILILINLVIWTMVWVYRRQLRRDK